MNRRGFFGLVIGSITAAILPKPKININDLFIPSKKQLDFLYGGFAGPGKIITVSNLYGIPYHENNAASGIWLGIERS